MTGQTGDDGTLKIGIMVLLKYLSNFQRALKMPLSNFEISVILTCFTNCAISSNAATNQQTISAIDKRKLYISVAPLSTQKTVESSNCKNKNL